MNDLPDADADGPPLGSWPRLYAAVVVCALCVMAAVAVFSHFPW